MGMTQESNEVGAPGAEVATPSPAVEAADLRGALDSPAEVVMSAPATFGDPELSVRATAAEMTRRGIGSMILIREDGPSAILTERDLVSALADGINPDVTWAVDVASEDVVSLERGDTVSDAIEAMVRYGVHHLPVKHDGNVVGVVSASDVLMALSGRLERLT